MRPRWAIFVRDRDTAPWRYAMMTEQWRIVDQFRRGITSGPDNLEVLTLPDRVPEDPATGARGELGPPAHMSAAGTSCDR